MYITDLYTKYSYGIKHASVTTTLSNDEEPIISTTIKWPVASEIDKTESIALQLLPAFKQLLKEESITESNEMLGLFRSLYLPMSASLTQINTDCHKKPKIIGINGSQGSGKTTLSKILELILTKGFDQSVVCISIDDLYKSKSARNVMAESIHPLFTTRGVPGTHNIPLGIKTFDSLITGQTTPIPRFSKAEDNVLNEDLWPIQDTGCDIILFEGWCVGSIACDDNQLKSPINSLEELYDRDGKWRTYSNACLRSEYQTLFKYIDILIHIQIDDFKDVFTWRKQQEDKLRTSLAKTKLTTSKLMNDEELKQFIMHYERLSLHNSRTLPKKCDIAIEINENQKVKKVRLNRQTKTDISK